MPQIFANNATSTLSAALTDVSVTVFVEPGHGARFPTIAAPDFMFCTLEDASGHLEIVKVTAHVAAAQSLTVERAQQGTTARAWAIGDLFELRFTAQEAGAWEADIDALQATRSLKAGETYTGAHDFTGATVKVAAPVADSDAANKAFVVAAAFSAALPPGNHGQVMRTDEGGHAGWGDWWGPPVRLTVADNGATLSVRRRYEVDSTGGPFTVHLPVMADTDWIKLVDASGKCSLNNVTIDLAGQTCRGEGSLLMDVAYDSFELVRTATGVIEQ